MRFGLVLKRRTEGVAEDFERIGVRRWIGLEFGKLAAEFAPVAE